MINEIVNYSIWGISIIRILGIITYALFVITALISIANARGIKYVNFKWHPRVAIISLIFATIHAFLVIILYL